MTDVRTIHTGMHNFNVDEREVQVVGLRQRIQPLAPEEISGEAKELCVQLRNSFATADPNFIPEIVATMLRRPDLYRCQMELSVQLAARGAISPRERELAVLRVGWLCRAPYEWGQHVEISKRFGMKPEEIERVTKGSSASGWDEHERAVLLAVEELLGDQSISDETWSVLARSWNEEQLMELPVLVGAYYMLALQQNSIKVRLPESNLGLRQR